MFVNGQDTTLLLGALVSAVNRLQSNGPNMESSDKKSLLLKDKHGVVEIVSSTITKLARDTSKVKTEMEFLRMQLQVNRRLHSAIFFVALRSNGITCTEANKFYESILHTFPTMNWKFYLKLNFQCNWSEYFIECAKQLQPDILAAVIKAFLPLCEEDNLLHYTWHLALQSIVWKFFHLEDPSIVEPVQEFAFHFPFEDLNATAQKIRDEQEAVFIENPPKSKLLHAFVTILNHTLQSSKTSLADFSFVKVVLHFYKTIFKLLKKTNACNGESIKELFRMNVLLEQCLKSDSSRSAIESGLSVPEYFLLGHCYVNTSWEICVNYLLFLVCNYWKDSVHRISDDVDGSFSSILSAFPPVDSELVAKLCPLFKEQFCADDADLKLLKAIICYDYPFASRAAGILLVHPDVRTTTEIIHILKEHVSKLSHVEIYPLLATAIVETDSVDTKDTFLKLFYQILSCPSSDLYNDALKYIIDHYGFNGHFKLPNVDSCLIEFTRKTMLLDEAEKFLLPLFIQIPLIVLRTLIEQALIRGAEGVAIIPGQLVNKSKVKHVSYSNINGKIYIDGPTSGVTFHLMKLKHASLDSNLPCMLKFWKAVLKHIPSVCCHNNHFPLVEELSHYFLKKELQTYEEKNIIHLVESVMEVQTEKEILSFDTFLEMCILPSFSNNIRIDLMLECLNVSLRILTNKAALNLSNSSFFSLMECLTFAIDDCIKSGNGKRKELVLLALSFLGGNQMLHGKFSERSPHFIKHLNSLDKVVIVYLKPFYEKETYEDTVDISTGISESSWVYCCHSENPKLEFKKRLCPKMTEYEDLLILTLLLPHFTKKEWMQSSYLLKEYFEHFPPDQLFSSVPFLLSKRDCQSYAVVRTLMDCYGFLFKSSSCDKQYVTSCFTNTVINILSQESHPQLLVIVFLDACHLTTIYKMDTLHLLSSFLISIKKSICQACDDKLLQTNYAKLAVTGVRCLPDSEAKSSLLQKL